MKKNRAEIAKLYKQREEYREKEAQLNSEILLAEKEKLNVEKQAKLDRLTAEGKLKNAYD